MYDDGVAQHATHGCDFGLLGVLPTQMEGMLAEKPSAGAVDRPFHGWKRSKSSGGYLRFCFKMMGSNLLIKTKYKDAAKVKLFRCE